MVAHIAHQAGKIEQWADMPRRQRQGLFKQGAGVRNQPMNGKASADAQQVIEG